MENEERYIKTIRVRIEPELLKRSKWKLISMTLMYLLLYDGVSVLGYILMI
jgi:hypothetical protein